MKLFLLSLIFFTSSIELKAQAPKFEWVLPFSSLFGNIDEYSLCTDINNNVYTTGYFSGTMFFDPYVGNFPLYSYGNKDAFIAKYDANKTLIWVKQIGGTSVETCYSIVTDSLANVYVSGFFTGKTDFDPSSGTYTLTANGVSDMFILKLDASGNFVWVKQFGGSNANSFGKAIRLDGIGNIYLTGNFNGAVDFDPSNNNFILNSLSNTNDDVFILKLDPSGNLIYANQIIGISNDYSYDLSIDKHNNIYVSGSFNGTTDFDPSGLVFNLISNGSSDIFISKFDISGNLIWAKNIGGASADDCSSICIDKFENLYCTGNFSGVVDFDPNSSIYNLNGSGSDNRYILKLSNAGNLIWAKNMGGIAYNHGNGIALDNEGNAYSTGVYLGTADFDPSIGVANLNTAGFGDVFISKIDSLGNFIWAGRIGGTQGDYGYSIKLDNDNNIYTTGFFSGQCEFDPDENEYVYETTSSNACYLHKMSQLHVGISEKTINDNLYIYPNPTNGIINIESEALNNGNIKIQLLNTLGQIMLEENVNTQQISFNMKGFSNGIYFLKIISDNKIISTQKIIKE